MVFSPPSTLIHIAYINDMSYFVLCQARPASDDDQTLLLCGVHVFAPAPIPQLPASHLQVVWVVKFDGSEKPLLLQGASHSKQIHGALRGSGSGEKIVRR